MKAGAEKKNLGTRNLMANPNFQRPLGPVWLATSGKVVRQGTHIATFRGNQEPAPETDKAVGMETMARVGFGAGSPETIKKKLGKTTVVVVSRAGPATACYSAFSRM